MVGDVAGAGAFGRVGVGRIERRELAGGGVEGVLEQRVGVFDVGNVDELVVGRREDGVGVEPSFVEAGDPGAGSAVFVDGIDVNLAAPITGAEEKAIVAVEREVAVAVREGDGLVTLALMFRSVGQTFAMLARMERICLYQDRVFPKDVLNPKLACPACFCAAPFPMNV